MIVNLSKVLDQRMVVTLGTLQVTSQEDTRNVAAAAANNDPDAGSLVAEAFEKVGKNGVITIEESEGVEMDWTWSEGMEFDRGYASPYFITDRENLSCELDDPYVPENFPT